MERSCIINTVCPKIGDKQWTCTYKECVCHLKNDLIDKRIKFLEEQMKLTDSDMFEYYACLEIDELEKIKIKKQIREEDICKPQESKS